MRVEGEEASTLAQHKQLFCVALRHLRILLASALLATVGAVLTPTPSNAEVEREPLTFQDLSEIDELTSAHADLFRLYWAFFDREPDVGGALYWLEQYERCHSMKSIVGWFADGAEFELTYGHLDNPAFVEQMYANVLDRLPDDDGATYWLDLLDRGALNRPDTMLYFSASVEFAQQHPLPSDNVPSRGCRLNKRRGSSPRSVQLLEPAPFAEAGGVTLFAPSVAVELIGFHESSNDAARHQTVIESELSSTTMESRNRDNPSRGSADIATNPLLPITSPVTGTVIRAGGYTLYCRYRDDYAVIEPDQHPGWEVKVLHIDGVQVEAGDRVEAGVTVLAPHARVLPFHSQIDDLTADPSWPHVHIEIVDPSLPDRPSAGGGC